VQQDTKTGEPHAADRKLRIFHLSDLHAPAEQGEEAVGQARVIEALHADLLTQAEVQAPDLIVFSGDLSFDGSTAALARGRDQLLDLIRQRFDQIPIVLVPGNHDVDRSKIDDVVDLGLERALSNADAVVARLEDEEKAAQARARLENWDAFAAQWTVGVEGAPEGPLASSYAFEAHGLKVSVGAFDTAWRSAGGSEDKGKLLLGAEYLRRFLTRQTDADIVIVTFHHPLEWLAEFDSKGVSNTLEGAGAVVLTGHDHIADPTLELTTRGAALYCRAPCSYDSPVYGNGYAILDIDAEAGETVVQLRRWYSDREAFDVDTPTTKDGKRTFQWPVEPGAIRPALQVSKSVALEPLAVIAQEKSVLADHRDDLQSHTVSDFAISPRLWPVPHTEVFGKSVDRRHRPPEAEPLEALAGHQVGIVSGPKMGGVTTTLLWLLEQHFLREGTHVPNYVRADSRFSLGRIKTTIDEARNRAEQTDAAVIVAVDDVAPGDTRALGRMIKMLQENPDVLFLFGCHEDDVETVVRALERHEITPARLYLGPFGRREARALVARIVGPESLELVGKILRLLQRQRLPRNPLNLAALVSVIVHEPNLTAINESGLLQSYVRVLLENPTAVDPEGLNMDYRRREHLLQEIAKYVVDHDVSRIPRIDIEKLVIDYFESIGYRSGSAGQQIDSLIRRRVLAEDERGVGFRYPALLHLFAAIAASDEDNEEFAVRIFEDPQKYAPIIVHIAGLKRNDAATLTRVSDDAESVRGRVAAAIDLKQFDLIKDQHGWSKIRSLDQVRALVKPRPEPPSEEELDEIYDEVADDSGEEIETRPFREPDTEGALGPLLVAFSLAAAVLQSSELVRDIDLRKRALRKIIEGWGVMTVLFALEEDVSGGMEDVVKPMFSQDKDDERRKSLIQHVARVFVINLMAVGLYVEAGSVHHEKILEEILDDETFMANTSNAMFASLLYAMLEFKDWPDRLSQLYDQHGDHPMVGEMVRTLALSEYQSEELSKRDDEEVENLLVKILSPDMDGSRGVVQARAAVSAEVRDRLRKSRTEARWADAEAIESEAEELEALPEDG
jgi:predicted MPP superfamily phosphohydrolase